MKKKRFIIYSLVGVIVVFAVWFSYQYKKMMDMGKLTPEEWVKKYK
ncbi:MAG: hypothetical protein KF781_03270 [Chitinophagaceae bacterium]|nr:hypothetical protein [Chitinophagaceae bacterium]MCW5904533.1 hypothetical protein [Chitinophagaceae bacterium]MCZ2223735.1 hypothetical protein [Chitinophagales bacterium]